MDPMEEADLLTSALRTNVFFLSFGLQIMTTIAYGVLSMHEDHSDSEAEGS